MELFARIVVGYHGCPEEYARDLLLGVRPVADWRPGTNHWDWLGHGMYFWEHSPEQAARWAREKYGSQGQAPAVVGAIIQLGTCLDLRDMATTAALAETYADFEWSFASLGQPLPGNIGPGGKRRSLDCLVINKRLDDARQRGIHFETVRGAFLEGDPAYPGAGFSRDAHIQVSVLNLDDILGVFRPNQRRSVRPTRPPVNWPRKCVRRSADSRYRDCVSSSSASFGWALSTPAAE